MSDPAPKNPLDYEPSAIEQQARIDVLQRRWAKAATLFGLACMWAATHGEVRHELRIGSDAWMLVSLGLFVLGGYLALAGSRSHLYLLSNRIADAVCRRIDEAARK